jgi:hypothetical protein
MSHMIEEVVRFLRLSVMLNTRLDSLLNEGGGDCWPGRGVLWRECVASYRIDKEDVCDMFDGIGIVS